VRRHLSAVEGRPVQKITPSEVARILHRLRNAGYSEWSRVHVYRILRGTFALAVRRGVLTRSPMDGLARSEIPKQRNARRQADLGPEQIERLVKAGGSERHRAALALAAYAGLRIGEVRALRWGNVDLEAGTLTVRASALRDGTIKPPKTEAGERTIPLLPALRRLLVAWRLRSPCAQDGDLVIYTAEGKVVQERNLRRALDSAKRKAGLDTIETRLSWHTLRKSFISIFATNLELPPTTLAKVSGHTDAGFTLKVYARDGRDDAAVVEDVLARAAAAKVGG
jgi:integrase